MSLGFDRLAMVTRRPSCTNAAQIAMKIAGGPRAWVPSAQQRPKPGVLEDRPVLRDNADSVR